MKVLFVCAGNTCRSCMAEILFNNMIGHDNIEAFSAGVAVVPGSKTSYNAAYVIHKNLDIDISDRVSVQLTLDMLEKADLVLTMTESIKYFLINSFSIYRQKIFTLKEFIGQNGDIIDPFGGNIEIYSETFNDLKNSLELLIDKLKEDKSIL